MRLSAHFDYFWHFNPFADHHNSKHIILRFYDLIADWTELLICRLIGGEVTRDLKIDEKAPIYIIDVVKYIRKNVPDVNNKGKTFLTLTLTELDLVNAGVWSL